MLDASQLRSRLCGEMFRLMMRQMLCDANIKCGGQSYPCHKLVLAAASPVLRAIIHANSESTGEISDLNLQLDGLSSFEVDCLLKYLYTGNVAEAHQMDSALSVAIEIFTEEKYAGLSWDQAHNLVAKQSLCNDATPDSSVKDTIEMTQLEEVNDQNPHQASQIVCHIETNQSIGITSADKVYSDIGEMESIVNKDEGPIVISDGQISQHKKRLRLIDDSDHFTVQAMLETQYETCGDNEPGDVQIFRTMTNARYVRSHVKLPQKPPFLCPCQNCGKIFESHQRLRSHYRHTHGEKKYKCDSCPLRFLYPKDLKSHVRTHTGEKPFVCELCGKGFSQMGSLTIHHKVHEKNDDDNVVFRPCPECSKKYCLKDRDKNVDYLNSFSTDLSSCICPNSNCAKKFSSLKCLKTHLKNDVCNPNKYHCGKCYTKFDSNIQLRYHVGTLHCTHKKRKKVKPGNKETVSHDVSLPNDHNLPTQLLAAFENDVDTSPMLCNVEEISGLLQLSEEVVIKGDE